MRAAAWLRLSTERVSSVKTALFLTRDELAELTGFKAAHCQARWLTRNRWRFVLTRRNEPRVAREHFNDRMGCSDGQSLVHANAINHAAAGEQPNFAALNRR
jgi:hypothetical protein